jgi:hypothetical protein
LKSGNHPAMGGAPLSSPPAAPRAKSACGGSKGVGRLCFPVLFQDRDAHFDALVADIHAAGTLGRIGNECVYLVLGFAAKRTSEDFILLVAFEKHESSMAGERPKSRSAKVQPGATLRAKVMWFQRSIERCYSRSRKIACLPIAFQSNRTPNSDRAGRRSNRAFDNPPHFLALVRLDQYIIAAELEDIHPKLVIAKARANNYCDVGAPLRYDFKDSPPISIRQCGVGHDCPHSWLSFQRPPGFVAITHRQHVNPAGFQCVQQRQTAFLSHDKHGLDFRWHIANRKKGADFAP